MSRSHSLVVGGSISGLLAARVLLRYFDRGTIFDRDVLPWAPVARRTATCRPFASAIARWNGRSTMCATRFATRSKPIPI